ncbi:hypothetical protein AVEN_55718-1 [Araneus ventricosus]|uniref:Uncharacterized protein n=1 Tax=Araneus ventricosus TaxID=182803 RepID=A0A4Y2M7J7_ARAVE|nr:hypothetical protein AVEN_55718-1 [Araneus ventricosus]
MTIHRRCPINNGATAQGRSSEGRCQGIEPSRGFDWDGSGGSGFGLVVEDEDSKGPAVSCCFRFCRGCGPQVGQPRHGPEWWHVPSHEEGRQSWCSRPETGFQKG